MQEFIDKTSETAGTPLNRATMMAIQGFIASTTEIKTDGSVVQTNANGETLTTVLNPDGSVTETFVGEKTIVKTTKRLGERIIEEVIE